MSGHPGAARQRIMSPLPPFAVRPWASIVQAAGQRRRPQTLLDA